MENNEEKQVKICTKCNMEKNIIQFGTRILPSGKISVKSHCKECRKNEIYIKKEDVNIFSKTCQNCNINKEISKFNIRKNPDETIYHRSNCTECELKKQIMYKQKDKNERRDKKEKKLLNKKSKICNKCKIDKPLNEFSQRIRYRNNGESYYDELSNCKKCAKEISKEFRTNNPISVRKTRIKTNKRRWIKIKLNPILKLRVGISSNIGQMLKRNNGNKNKESIMNYLSYTISELKLHIESQWICEKSWMNWNNYGKYITGGERKWHIDHIIPQSALPFDSMKHPNFLKCWSLNNLQPLDAVENIQKYNKINFYNKNIETINTIA